MQVQQNKGKLQDARFISRGSAKPVDDYKETKMQVQQNKGKLRDARFISRGSAKPVDD